MPSSGEGACLTSNEATSHGLLGHPRRTVHSAKSSDKTWRKVHLEEGMENHVTLSSLPRRKPNKSKETAKGMTPEDALLESVLICYWGRKKGK